MTKLEELSELLVAEIKDFEEAVKKLEEIRKSKIQLDLQNLQHLLFEHRQHVERILQQHQRHFQMIEKFSTEARGHLKKGLILIVVGIFLNLISVAVVVYLVMSKL